MTPTQDLTALVRNPNVVLRQSRRDEIAAALEAKDAEIARLRGLLEDREFASADDRDDHLTPAIEATYSAKKGGYWGMYMVANAAVSNRYSKGALCHLVTHLMFERDDARAALRTEGGKG